MYLATWPVIAKLHDRQLDRVDARLTIPDDAVNPFLQGVPDALWQFMAARLITGRGRVEIVPRGHLYELLDRHRGNVLRATYVQNFDRGGAVGW
jgi:hypothetical protein